MDNNSIGHATVAKSQRKRELLMRGIAVVLVAALAAWGATLIAPWMKPDSKIETSPALATVPVSQPPAVQPASAIATELPGVDAFEAERPIPLHLVETWPGRNAREGSASIGTSPDNSQTYAAGGLLPNEARLIEVHSDHVLLERSGRRVALYVHGTKEPKVYGASDLSDRMKAKATVLSVGGKDGRSDEVRAPAVGRAAAVLRTQPLFQNGAVRGLQVHPAQSADQFASLGLKAGDVVTAIDGRRVSDAQQAADLFSALNAGIPVTVTVERQGRLEHLSLDLGAPSRSPPAPRTDDPHGPTAASAGGESEPPLLPTS